MALLQVKNFPDDLYEELKRRAAAGDRSVAKEVVRNCRQSLGQSKKEKRQEALRRLWNTNPPQSFKDFDFAAAIREERDSR